MESFKANFIIFIFIAGVMALGYWAVIGISAENVSIIERSSSSDVGPVVTSGPDTNGSPIDVSTIDLPPASPNPVVTNPEPEPPAPTTEPNKHAALIAQLEQLIEDKILMKKGSRGTRVGTVQQFLKLYGITMTVDNDYGDTTVTAVKKFQTEQKLPADGQTGEGTYKNMIEWLENN